MAAGLGNRCARAIDVTVAALSAPLVDAPLTGLMAIRHKMPSGALCRGSREYRSATAGPNMAEHAKIGIIPARPNSTDAPAYLHFSRHRHRQAVSVHLRTSAAIGPRLTTQTTGRFRRVRMAGEHAVERSPVNADVANQSSGSSAFSAALTPRGPTGSDEWWSAGTQPHSRCHQIDRGPVVRHADPSFGRLITAGGNAVPSLEQHRAVGGGPY